MDELGAALCRVAEFVDGKRVDPSPASGFRLEYGHALAGPRELAGGHQAGGAGADHHKMRQMLRGHRQQVISEPRRQWEKIMTEDAAWPLAQHICRTGYADLPVSAVESARRDILDTFGCMLGGSGSPGIGELFAVISHWGGLPESRVLLRGIRLPAPSAALLNASMGHALDFDDTLDSGGSIHPGVSVLASVLAVCDSLNGVTGRDLLLAVALGLDISCRIALASTLDRGWHRTAAIGVFGAAAAAGKLIGLTPEQMLAAFGIAYSHAAGNRQCILDGALTKRMQAGQAASAGVFSAVLA